MEVKNLNFFDNRGYNLNFEWNNTLNVWEGKIYFPKVSVGRYVNTTIHIMENIESNNDYDFYFPQKDKSDEKIMFRWDLLNVFVDEFFMFTFDEKYFATHKIDSSALHFELNDGPDVETLIVNKFDEYEVELDDTMSKKTLPVHIAFSTPEKYDANTYKRTLNMFYGRTMIAKITFYAESVEEDERLKILNNNLGYKITPKDTIIFKDSDIKEYYPDYKLLNEKRKELLVEGSNIYPYIGSYKAIINAIKFFGYENLNIVEYWRNVNSESENFGKVFASSKYSLTNKETISIKGKKIPLPNPYYRKTNEISLVYTINHPLNEVDELEIPFIKEDFTYTIEEAIIKLFELRRKLNSEFMPSSSRIVDIIGEATYFGLNEILNQVVIPEKKVEFDPKRYQYGSIDIFPSKFIHISDSRNFIDYANKEYMNDENVDGYDVNTITLDTTLKNIENKTISELGEFAQSKYSLLNDYGNEKSKVSYYKSYYNRVYKDCIEDEIFEPNIHDQLTEDIKLSAKVILTNTSFKDVLFSDLPDKIGSEKIKNNWNFDNIDRKYYGFDEIKWIISFSENQIDDELKNVNIYKKFEDREFTPISIGGDINDYQTVFIELPYVGYYDITMEFIDVNDNNRNISYSFSKAIKVETYNLDIRGFYYDARALPKEIDYDKSGYGLVISDEEDGDYSINDYEDFILKKITHMTNGATIEHYAEENTDKSMPYYSTDGSIINAGPYKSNYINQYWDLLDNINYDITTLEPNVRDARYIKNGVDVKPYTWFLLGFNETKITSIVNPKWKLTNLTTKDIVEHEGRYFTLLLKKEGDYNISLTLEDTNGNKYSISKNIIVVDKDANYKLYHRFKEDYDAQMEIINTRNEKLYSDFAALSMDMDIIEQ